MKGNFRRIVFLSVFAFVVADFVLWSQAPQKHTRWCALSDFTYDPEKESIVSIVPSDHPSLSRPCPITEKLDYEQVEEMVSLAVDLAGGLENLLEPTDRKIVIKPNLVEPAPNGNGANTDWRVVRALVLLLYRLNPEFEIVVAEGAGDWARPGTPLVSDSALEGDGYEVSGYREMIEFLQNDPDFPGLNLRWVDLNYDQVTEIPVPGPRLSDCQTSFFLPRTVLGADFVINVPVLKVHSTCITAGLKNWIGLLPGMVYGWPKALGYNNNGIRLDHDTEFIHKNIADLVRTVGCDLVVVDCIVGKEKTKFRWGNPRRRNMIVAGDDVVSVDAVCASLIGLNPEDVEHITLAALSGVGQNDLERIEVRGGLIDECKTRFVKAENELPLDHKNKLYPYYGQGNRVWLLNGPHPGLDMKTDYLGGEAGAAPLPELDGWSQPIFFFDNTIDPAGYFQDSVDCTYYAFTYLQAHQDTRARLWLGSSGNIKVWLNGEVVYTYDNGTRAHKLPNDLVEVNISAGLNRILVKAPMQYGICEFSLNVCEPENDKNYAGNRLEGVRFVTDFRL
ncbi:MAG TPA: DUF362 domain-containing protein [archaeon]|nr:DUF362 domain-containing protein [archaeon]